MFEALRWRLTAWCVLVFSLAFIIVGLLVFLWTNKRFSDDVHDAIRSVSSQAQSEVESRNDLGGSSDAVKNLLERTNLRGPADVSVLLVGANGALVANPDNVDVTELPNAPAIEHARAAGEDWRTVEINGQEIELRTVPAYGADGSLLGFIQAGKSVEERDASLRTLAIVMAVGGLTGLAFATAGGLFVAGLAIRPIRRSFERQREFVADASHELRTPLSVIRVNAETASIAGADAESVSDIAAEAAYMSRLLDDLLVLARSDSGDLDLKLVETDLGDLVRSSARSVETLMRDAGLALRVEADPAADLRVRADPERIREVLLIVLDNALKYTPRGGSVTIRASDEGGDAVVEVIDTGIGVDPAELGRLFDRFYRVDKARSRSVGGTGLGLSIAKEIVDAHGASLRLKSAPGAGMTVTLRMRRIAARATSPVLAHEP